VSPGYWRRPEATAESHADGWFRTGDIGVMDEQRYLIIVDRAKDMLIVGGENVYPSEVERVLRNHPRVADCAVIGIPHAMWGEEVLALVVLQPGDEVDARVLIAHCRASLARYKCPTKVEWVGQIPRNAAGKIEKVKLREPHWAGRRRVV
jgi:acyl-CoA synthetase (AMP-forming)/AMP-acid ligase II